MGFKNGLLFDINKKPQNYRDPGVERKKEEKF